MFLDESVMTNLNGGSSDPAWMLESVMDYENQMHELTMKMIKCEHYCIVNEDSNMLNEAGADFKEKAKNLGKGLINNFKRFVSRVVADWTRFWSMMQSKLVNLKKMQSRFDHIERLLKDVATKGDDKTKKRYTVNIKDFRPIVDAFKTAVDENSNQSFKDAISDKRGNSFVAKIETTKDVLINGAIVKSACEFLANRPTMITMLKSTIVKAEKKAKEGEAEATASTASTNSGAVYCRSVSQAVSFVNRYTSSAVKVCRVASKVLGGKANKDTRDAIAKDYKGNKNKDAYKYSAKKSSSTPAGYNPEPDYDAITNFESTSILDMF